MFILLVFLTYVCHDARSRESKLATFGSVSRGVFFFNFPNAAHKQINLKRPWTARDLFSLNPDEGCSKANALWCAYLNTVALRLLLAYTLDRI